LSYNLNHMLKNILLVFSVLAVLALSAHASVLDSIGIEKKAGKTYIVHKVEAKETLYSISKKYDVTVDEIKKENPDVAVADMKIGQTLFIPYKGSVAAPVTASAKKIHTVEAKETLYSIAKKYDITVDELKKANPEVAVSEMKIGQVLVIPVKGNATVPVVNSSKTHTVETKETLYSISKKYDISVDELKSANSGVTDLKVGQVLNIPAKGKIVAIAEKKPEEKKIEPVADKKNEPAKQQAPPPPSYSSIKKDGYTKVNESGIAEMYEANADFHYALHATAPIGTIIYVVNEESGQKVYVRVMGKLTDATPGVIMKVSSKAFQKISKDGNKVKVNVSYIP
jgi:LysM repeat protein